MLDARYLFLAVGDQIPAIIEQQSKIGSPSPDM